MLIVIELHPDRNRAGWLRLEDGSGHIVAGPFPVAGRAGDAAARKFGNPDRIPTLPYGDTPLGSYRVVRVARSAAYAEASFGPHGVILLEGTAGDAALAEANGRFVLLIQGGDAGTGGALRCTNGALRLRNDDLRSLLEAMPRHVPVQCRCTEVRYEQWPFAGAEPLVDTELACFDGDAMQTPPPMDEGAGEPFAGGTPWIMPRYVRATAMAVIAHGEYDPGPGGGTTTHPPPDPPDPPEPLPAPVPGPAPTPSPTPAPPDPVATLAKSLRDNPRVSFATIHVTTPPDDATAQKNIDDAAAGRAVSRSNPPGGTVTLDRNMLEALNKLAQEFSYTVSELAGGHTTGAHIQGKAFDVNFINGIHVDSNNPDFRAFEQRCRDLGAAVVKGPGDPGHDTHVHCGFP